MTLSKKLTVLRNCREIITLEGAVKKRGRNLLPEDLGLLKNGSIVFSKDSIEWVGKDKELPIEYKNLPSISGGNLLVTPAFVDCHTHLIFGGNRALEYTQRLNGKSYQEIAKEGGGILYTTKQTGKMGRQELEESSWKKILSFAKKGIYTIEIKTGYGLSFEKEIFLLEILNSLKKRANEHHLDLFITYMGAHAIPAGYTSSRFCHEVVFPVINQCHHLMDAVDIFLEEGYFSLNDTRELFDLAKQYSLPVKIHAEEFTHQKGTLTAIEYNALSADHLLQANEDDFKALANSQTVAVILPGTAFFLGKPLVRALELLQSGCQVAIGSDFNPGSCNFSDVFALARLSAPSLKFNVAQLWAAITYNAACALGKYGLGAIIPKMAPKFCYFQDIYSEELLYNWDERPLPILLEVPIY